MNQESGDYMPIAKTNLFGGITGIALKVVFGLLLSLLSWNGLKLCERMDGAEARIVQLQIADASRDVQLRSIEKKLDEISGDLKQLIRYRAP
jgi:hypothetical protein